MIRMRAIVELDSAIDDIDAIRDALILGTSREGDNIKSLFEQTIKHWNKSKFGGFKKISKVVRGGAYTEVSTTDTIYYFINGGTSERYAIMSGDWVSQTTPRSLVSKQGRGKAVARGRKAVPTAQPGIEARHFDEEIVKQRKPIYERNMNAIAAATVKVLF